MRNRQTGTSRTERHEQTLLLWERGDKHQEQQLLQKILLQQRVKAWLDGILGGPHQVGDS